MDMLKAEALVRLNRATEAIPLINKTRIANGQLPAIDINGPPDVAGLRAAEDDRQRAAVSGMRCATRSGSRAPASTDRWRTGTRADGTRSRPTRSSCSRFRVASSRFSGCRSTRMAAAAPAARRRPHGTSVRPGSRCRGVREFACRPGDCRRDDRTGQPKFRAVSCGPERPH